MSEQEKKTGFDPYEISEEEKKAILGDPNSEKSSENQFSQKDDSGSDPTIRTEKGDQGEKPDSGNVDGNGTAEPESPRFDKNGNPITGDPEIDMRAEVTRRQQEAAELRKKLDFYEQRDKIADLQAREKKLSPQKTDTGYTAEELEDLRETDPDKYIDAVLEQKFNERMAQNPQHDPQLQAEAGSIVEQNLLGAIKSMPQYSDMTEMDMMNKLNDKNSYLSQDLSMIGQFVSRLQPEREIAGIKMYSQQDFQYAVNALFSGRNNDQIATESRQRTIESMQAAQSGGSPLAGAGGSGGNTVKKLSDYTAEDILNMSDREIADLKGNT